MPLHPILATQLPTEGDEQQDATAFLPLLHGVVHQVEFVDAHHLLLTYSNYRIMLAATPDGIAIGLENCPTC